MDQTSSTKYSTVSGLFLQDEPSTDPESFNYVIIYPQLRDRTIRLINLQSASDFGLIKRSYNTDKDYDPGQKKTQWERFNQKVSELNSQAGNSVRYKVIYMVTIQSLPLTA